VADCETESLNSVVSPSGLSKLTTDQFIVEIYWFIDW